MLSPDIPTDAQVEEYLPSVDEMVQDWENTLNIRSNPANGGQKEFLPGDDVILLSTQIFVYQSRYQSGKECTASHILALTLQEHTVLLSPFNLYLKITTIGIYTRHDTSFRAWDIFESINICQIQLDSCSYLILSRLVYGGIYREAV